MPGRMLGQPGFQEDIAPLVTDQEQQCMKSVNRGAFDLKEWNNVAPRANLILQHLKGENGLALMPPGGWPQEKIAKFSSWVDEGTPKQRGERYSDFFRSIDGQTEYFDVYGSKEGLEDMGPYYSRFFGPGLLLQGPWLDYMKISPSTPILKKQKQELWNKVVSTANEANTEEGLIKIDEWLCSLVVSHFASNGNLDSESLFDAFSNFGADTLPLDDDRAQRVKNLNNPNDYRLVNNFAQFHRMDSRSMWFFWFGHLQCVRAALGARTTDRDGIRNALLASIFVGQTVDTAYREGSNRRTRPAYTGDGGKENIIKTANILLTDWDSAIEEMEELFLIWSGTAIA